MLLLRREYGISAREALTEMPAWEYDVLLEAVQRNHTDEDSTLEPRGGPGRDPFAQAPTGLELLG